MSLSPGSYYGAPTGFIFVTSIETVWAAQASWLTSPTSRPRQHRRPWFSKPSSLRSWTRNWPSTSTSPRPIPELWRTRSSPAGSETSARSRSAGVVVDVLIEALQAGLVRETQMVEAEGVLNAAQQRVVVVRRLVGGPGFRERRDDKSARSTAA